KKNVAPWFSPDGKTLFTRDAAKWEIRLWEVATGKERRRWGKEKSAQAVLSPDGKRAASVTGIVVRVWEVATGKEVRRLRGHRGPVTSLAFSPDGGALVSGSADTTALVWDLSDLTAAKPSQPRRLSDKELGQLWADLASPDATRAYRAIEQLT